MIPCDHRVHLGWRATNPNHDQQWLCASKSSHGLVAFRRDSYRMSLRHAKLVTVIRRTPGHRRRVFANVYAALHCRKRDRWCSEKANSVCYVYQLRGWLRRRKPRMPNEPFGGAAAFANAAELPFTIWRKHSPFSFGCVPGAPAATCPYCSGHASSGYSLCCINCGSRGLRTFAWIAMYSRINHHGDPYLVTTPSFRILANLSVLKDSISTYIKCDPGRPHPVKVTLEDGWQAVPPSRIHRHDGVGLS
jgi:hypothetical protein